MPVSAARGGNSSPHFAAVDNFGTVRLLWTSNIDNPTNGNAYQILSRAWTGDQWAITEALSSGHVTQDDLAVAVDAHGQGCAVFGVYNPADPGYSVEAACLTENE